MIGIKDWIMGTGPLHSYKKCYLCDKYATWINEEEEKGYCDHHFVGRICDCDICKNGRENEL